MSLKSCKAQLRAYIKDQAIRVDESDISQMAKAMESELQKNPTPAQFLAKMYEKVDVHAARESAARRASRLLDLAVNQSIIDNAVSLDQRVPLAEYLRNHYEGGALKGHYGSNIDPVGVADLYKTQFDRLIQSQMTPDLRRVFESDSLGHEPWQALDALKKGEEIPKGVHPEAVEIAKAVHATNEFRASLKKAVNPQFNKSEGYFAGRNWDSAKVFGDGTPEAKQAWIDFMLSKFGKNTFEDLTPVEKVKRLSEDHQNIVNGTYGTGAGGVRGQMARSRTYVANDFMAEYEANQKYGPGTLAQATAESNLTDARQIAKLRKFTNDPEAQAKTLYRGMQELAKSRSDSVVQLEKLAKMKKYIDQASRATAMGEANLPARGYWPKTLDSGMKLMSMALTGGSSLSTIPDLAIAAHTVTDSMGRNLGEIHAQLMRYYTKGLTDSAQAKIFSDSVGLYTRTHAAAILRDYGLGSTPTAGVAGKIFKGVDRLSQNFSRWNGMERIMAAERYSTGAVVTSALAEDVLKPYSALTEQQKYAGSRYGFTDEKWRTYKFALTEIPGEEGKFLTPGSVMQLPDEVVENYLRKTGTLEEGKTAGEAILTRGRMELAEPVAAMVYDHAQIGSSTPGTRQRAFFYRGQSINDGMGQFWRLVWQLKQSSMVSSDAMRRSYRSGEIPLQGSLTGPAALAAELVFLTSLGYWAKEATKGKTPEDPRTIHFAGNVLARSGMGFIVGDILAQSLERNGLTDKALALFEGASGPVLGQGAEAIATAAQGATSGKLPRARVSQFLTNTLAGPLQNHIAVGPIFNYYFTNALREKLNPGYIGRVTNKVSQTPGIPGFTPTDRQQFYILDPRTAPRW